ncbi:MAG: 5-(carboxyamino)imidazole ribonucleotide synthase [Alistipes sp.]
MKTVGIIGAGQLGLMLITEIHRLGARAIALDPDAQAPAFRCCDERIVAAYDDPEALEKLCRSCDVVTYEFENVPGSVLIPLVEKYNIPQGFKPLYDSQDRLREKTNARNHALQTPLFEPIDDESSLLAATQKLGFPCVLKTRTLGYDGHGQCVLHCAEELAQALPMLAVPCILEEFVRFDYEVSLVLVRDAQQTIHFPVGRNIHRDGILDLCVVPAQMDDALLERMVAAGGRFMEQCGYEGILAIEFFVRGNEFLFNEMAPRPHNSGHYTIEGCTTNQFRELARYLLGEELQKPTLVAPTVMKNILGQDLVAAEAIAAQTMAGDGVYVHLYGKTESRPKRKMGHITFVGATSTAYAAAWAERFVK